MLILICKPSTVTEIIGCSQTLSFDQLQEALFGAGGGDGGGSAASQSAQQTFRQTSIWGRAAAAARLRLLQLAAG